MGSDNFIELEAGAGTWFKILYFLVALLAVLAILTANTGWFIKLTVLGALFLSAVFRTGKYVNRNPSANCGFTAIAP